MIKSRRIFFVLIFIILVFLSILAFHSSAGGTFRLVLKQTLSTLSDARFYESLANPTIAYVRVVEGARKEEIVQNLEKKFRWDKKDINDFLAYDDLRERKFEGKYFPDVYLVPKEISGKEMRDLMNERFDEKLLKLKTVAKDKNLNFDSVVIIASIIQREAANKTDMFLISGVIWNRLFSGMKLQMDATLQYAKGNDESGWWPRVSPEDKSVSSPYNTYKNSGLPPSPISNPGLAAIEAAINPQKTSCLFYFHKNRQIYCSKTYEEHKNKIDVYLK